MQTLVRKIGNSTGTIIPASLLKKLDLKEGDRVDIQDDNGRILISPNRTRPQYTLTELLAKCDQSAPMPQELIDWDNTPEVGNETW
ncbi:MAG: AbrB/MazE/SpoVT family DNA-binding domain-containing protein [Methylococcales bacterium]